jgi:hypothetical protein
MSLQNWHQVSSPPPVLETWKGSYLFQAILASKSSSTNAPQLHFRLERLHRGIS